MKEQIFQYSSVSSIVMAAFSAANSDFDWSPAGNCASEENWEYYPAPGALELLIAFLSIQAVFLAIELCKLPTDDDSLTAEAIVEKTKNPCLHICNLVLTLAGSLVGLVVIFSSENGQDVQGLWTYVYVVATYLVKIKGRIWSGSDVSEKCTVDVPPGVGSIIAA